jgi:hypothetical protein
VSDIEDAIKKMSSTLDDIHHRLFVDNGKPSIQTRLDRSERTIENISRLTWISITTVVGLIIAKVVGK